MQDEAFAGGEAETNPPALPADLPAVDLEARSVRLDDLERFEVIPQRPDAIGGVGARARRQRHHAQVLDPHYSHGVEIHDGVESVDGLGVRVIIGPLAIEQQRPSDPASGLRGIGERADPPGLDQHPLGDGDATPLEARQNPRVSPGHELALGVLRQRHRGVHVGTDRQDTTEPSVRDTTAS